MRLLWLDDSPQTRVVQASTHCIRTDRHSDVLLQRFPDLYSCFLPASGHLSDAVKLVPLGQFGRSTLFLNDTARKLLGSNSADRGTINTSQGFYLAGTAALLEVQDDLILVIGAD